MGERENDLEYERRLECRLLGEYLRGDGDLRDLGERRLGERDLERDRLRAGLGEKLRGRPVLRSNVNAISSSPLSSESLDISTLIPL